MSPGWLGLYLHDLSFVSIDGSNFDGEQPDYFYRGYCPQRQRHYQLPRTGLAKAVARGLMQDLAADPQLHHEGKMYGVLLVRTKTAQTVYLKAFSGLLQGEATRPGWVPPIPGRGQVALREAETVQALEAMKQRLMSLQNLPDRQRYADLLTALDHQRHHLNQCHRQRKQARNQQRQKLMQTLQGEALERALAALAQESRRDKAELRAFKQAKHEQLGPLQDRIQAADAEMQILKQKRQALSRQLQAEMHQAYRLTNFAGQSLTVQALAGDGALPTGTGDCCAPKLLHFAAEHELTPLAMAEFWWGSDTADKQRGQFYGACAERCQPIMGFLLAGLSAEPANAPYSQNLSLKILYEDDELLAVDKPAGLLSVPGRYSHCQDSVLSRIKGLFPNPKEWVAVHRLDQDTSGVLVLARTPTAERNLRRQFQNHQVAKVYEALVDGQPASPQGMITLPLWSNPQQRPKQTVDWQRGKPCQTRYQVLGREGNATRVEFYPLTGRTHQLRVHAAHPTGLNAPIVGDGLYGSRPDGQRLCLHARQLQLRHPGHGQKLTLEAVTPF
jgi:tRNA pseudouridine32 synthase/23S rRNA pseudouridine746 synthase